MPHTTRRPAVSSTRNTTSPDSRKALVKNDDGSVDLYFGPEAPKGKEKNWMIPTVPRRGWFAYFRLYAPTEAYFDRSWKLPDVVRVKRPFPARCNHSWLRRYSCSASVFFLAQSGSR